MCKKDPLIRGRSFEKTFFQTHFRLVLARSNGTLSTSSAARKKFRGGFFAQVTSPVRGKRRNSLLLFLYSSREKRSDGTVRSNSLLGNAVFFPATKEAGSVNLDERRFRRSREFPFDQLPIPKTHRFLYPSRMELFARRKTKRSVRSRPRRRMDFKEKFTLPILSRLSAFRFCNRSEATATSLSTTSRKKGGKRGTEKNRRRESGFSSQLGNNYAEKAHRSSLRTRWKLSISGLWPSPSRRVEKGA